jgi:hypothetical protein
MESRFQLRFWRVLLWGTITFPLFSASFWFLWDAYLTHLIHKAPVASTPPSPVPIYIVAAVLTSLFTVLSIFALWKFRARREATPLHQFLGQKGNAELCVHLLLLVLLLTVSSSVWQSVPWTTCRCCLFTTDSVCSRTDLSLPSPGFYSNTSASDGIRTGVYKIENKGVSQLGLNKFSLENVQFVRTRYGWPFRTITIDAAPDKFEWHAASEIWLFPNLGILFLGWLSLQSVGGIGRWLLRRITSTV